MTVGRVSKENLKENFDAENRSRAYNKRGIEVETRSQSSKPNIYKRGVEVEYIRGPFRGALKRSKLPAFVGSVPRSSSSKQYFEVERRSSTSKIWFRFSDFSLREMQGLAFVHGDIGGRIEKKGFKDGDYWVLLELIGPYWVVHGKF